MCDYIVASQLCRSVASLAIVAQSAGPLSREIRIPAHIYEYSAYCCDCLLVSCWQTWSRGSVGRDRMRIRDSATPTINILHNWETATRRPQRTIHSLLFIFGPLQIMTRPKLLMAKSHFRFSLLPQIILPSFARLVNILSNSLLTSWSFYVLYVCMY